MTRFDQDQPDTPLPEVPAAFEAELRGLPWRTPGASLDHRVAAALAEEPPAGYALPWVRRWTAAAAVVLLGLGIGLVVAMVTRGPDTPTNRIAQAPTPEIAAADPAPVTSPRIEEVWVTSEPTGQWVYDNGRALEAVRVTTLRQVSFEDEDGVAYEVSVPTEQVMFVPASYE